ncbi:dolichol kinase [archaeon]|jgi:dolichol kinase|nr:dolichol kinase [archaeon]NHV06573.1 dolichol kinase [Nitrososphaerota archaeon]
MEIIGISSEDIIADLPIVAVLVIWNLFVILVLSKEVYKFALRKGRSEHSSMYFSRKVIHFLAGGLTAALLPFIAKEPFLPALLAFGFALMTYVPHKINKLMYWFQDPENAYEVDFTIVWGIVILLTWYIDKTFWLGVIPVLFMSWGDGITGIIRNLMYNKRTKAWEGTMGMLILDTIIGAKMGLAGIIAAVVSALVERIEFLDDNVSVPLVSLIILLIAKIYFTPLTIPLF